MGILIGSIRQLRRLSLSLLVLGLLLFIAPARGLSQAVDEYEVKAAFLFNFTKFVEWPQSGDASNFAICVLGDDPFGSSLDRLTKGKTVAGRTIDIRRLKEPADAGKCQIVFVRSEESGKASKLVEAVRGTPVLTVGETRDFVRNGGVIYLSMDDDRVNVVVNTAAADSGGVKISAKLLSVAKLLKDTERAEK